MGLGAAAIVSIVRVIINDIYNRLEGASAFVLMSDNVHSSNN